MTHITKQLFLIKLKKYFCEVLIYAFCVKKKIDYYQQKSFIVIQKSKFTDVLFKAFEKI